MPLYYVTAATFDGSWHAAVHADVVYPVVFPFRWFQYDCCVRHLKHFQNSANSHIDLIEGY